MKLQIRSAKANNKLSPHQINALETSLKIERSKIQYICLAYDLAIPEEHPLPPIVETEENKLEIGDQEKVGEKREDILGVVESRTEVVTEEKETEIIPEKNIKELVTEKKKEIEGIEETVIALEEELSKFVEIENFDKADSLQMQINEFLERKKELLSWIEQNKSKSSN